MRYIILSFIALCCVFITIACRKDPIPKEVVTTVIGYAVDSSRNNKRLANVTVEINGCKQGFYGYSCHKLLASTQTDANGEFSITFNSDGESVGFEASVLIDDIIFNSSRVLLIPGITNEIIVNTIEKSYLKTHLKILKNPFDSIRFLAGNWQTFYGITFDTVILSRVNPNFKNNIIIEVFDTDTNRTRRHIDYLNIDSRDTNYHQIIIDNTKELDILQ